MRVAQVVAFSVLASAQGQILYGAPHVAAPVRHVTPVHTAPAHVARPAPVMYGPAHAPAAVHSYGPAPVHSYSPAPVYSYGPAAHTTASTSSSSTASPSTGQVEDSTSDTLGAGGADAKGDTHYGFAWHVARRNPHYIRDYNAGTRADLVVATFPDFPANDFLGPYGAVKYADGYFYNADTFEDMIDHEFEEAYTSGNEIPWREIRNLEYQVDRFDHMGRAFRGVALGFPEIITGHHKIRSREANRNIARMNYHDAMDAYYEADAAGAHDAYDELRRASKGYYAAKQDVRSQRLNYINNIGGLGLPSALTNLPWYRGQSERLHVAYENLDDAYWDYYQDPTMENWDNYLLADYTAGSAKWVRTARLGALLGNPLLEALAWKKGGEYDDDYYDLAEEIAAEAYFDNYGFWPEDHYYDY